MELTAEQVRVLGCLLEKERTTPQLYPLTEAALVTACNQSTNREPVVSYDQSTVRRTLLELRQLGLARMVHRPGDRVEKHRHMLTEAWSLDWAQAAVLTVLMLRGPQTVSEIRTRTERLHPFGSIAEVEATLQELVDWEPEPLVLLAPRQPGQSQPRFRHLLTGEEDVPEAPAGASPAPVARSDALGDLREEVSALRERVARLEQRLEEAGIVVGDAVDPVADTTELQ